MNDYGPPKLSSLTPVLEVIPHEILPWIAEMHLKYLDDRIHKIGILTDYLAGCKEVEDERNEFIKFVEDWARSENTDLADYLRQYASRFHSVRGRVEALCDKVLKEPQLWSDKKRLLEFWREFCFINEIDSLHGMFLTSGRWYVNVMLPVVKELVFCSLPPEVDHKRNLVAYEVARRVITPRFARVSVDYDPSFEKQFARLLMPLLQYYDRKLLFLFDALSNTQTADGWTLADFVEDVTRDPTRYEKLIEMGVYPPFAWHELIASKKRSRKPAPAYDQATNGLRQASASVYESRLGKALTALDVFKEYELNYNNYNYKGRFGLISKLQYWQTGQQLSSPKVADNFFDLILLDRFFEALSLVEKDIAQ